MSVFERESMERFRTNLAVLLGLGVSFANGIGVPRLLILCVGEQEYSRYAILVGFAALYAFCDLGMQPGITALLAERGTGLRDEELPGLVGFVFRRCFWTWLAGLLASLAVWLYLYGATHLEELAVFAIASYGLSMAELLLLVPRVFDGPARSYELRFLMGLIQLFLVVGCYTTIGHISIGIVLATQLSAVVLYLGAAWGLCRGYVRPVGAVSSDMRRAQHWNTIWELSKAERRNRMMNFAVGLIERPLLLQTGGAGFVTVYDFILRYSNLIGTVPTALNQPVMALIARAKAHGDRLQIGEIFQRSLRMTCWGTGVGVTAAGFFWLFGRNTVVTPMFTNDVVAAVIYTAFAVNLLTAPYIYLQTVHGEIEDAKKKAKIEIGFTICALVSCVAAGEARVYALTKCGGTLFAACHYLRAGLAAKRRILGRA